MIRKCLLVDWPRVGVPRRGRAVGLAGALARVFWMAVVGVGVTWGGAMVCEARAEVGRDLIEQLDEAVGRVTDLEAKFVQEKVSPNLDRPLVSTGRVQLKGQWVRWETVEPQPTVMVVNRERVEIYYPRLQVMEVYDVPEKAQRLVLSPLGRWSQLMEYFDFSTVTGPAPVPGVTPGVAPSGAGAGFPTGESEETENAGGDDSGLDGSKNNEGGAEDEGHILLLLVPKVERLGQFVTEAVVRVDRGSALVDKAVISEPDGGRVVIEFKDIRTNQGLTDEQLRLVVPATTEVHKR